jgi:hypothetical protein
LKEQRGWARQAGYVPLGCAWPSVVGCAASRLAPFIFPGIAASRNASAMSGIIPAMPCRPPRTQEARCRSASTPPESGSDRAGKRIFARRPPSPRNEGPQTHLQRGGRLLFGLGPRDADPPRGTCAAEGPDAPERLDPFPIAKCVARRHVRRAGYPTLPPCLGVRALGQTSTRRHPRL